MEQVQLGRTGLTSSVIGLGGGSSGRFGLKKGGSRADAIRLIRTALDLGITFFDGAGLAGGVDELLAEGLGSDRQHVLLSTKAHLGPDPLFHSRRANHLSAGLARRFGFVCSPRILRKRVEQTLRALKRDRIDLLHLHAVSPRQYPQAAARLMPELVRMKEEGKLRAIGVTEAFLRDPRHEMLGKAVRDASVDAIMVGFNIRNPSAAASVIPTAHDAGIGVVGMFAVRGLLEHRAALEPIIEEAGLSSLAELAYRYTRHESGIDVLLTGTGDAKHLRENVAAALAPPLSAELIERLRAFQAEGVSTR